MNLRQLSRGPRTLLAGMLFLAMYVVYSRVTSPFLSVETPRRAAEPRTPRPQQSPDFATLSAAWFREDPWVATAGKKFRDGERYLFFQNFKLSEDNRVVRVDPVAMLWRSDRDEQPITVSAASARLEGTSSFSMSESEFGRIVAGQLEGDVYIRGPDGLRISGRNFHVSESAMMIWTSQPVNFAWEQHTGRAEDGVEIRLLSSPDATDGLMSLTDIHSIRLNGRVTCDLVMPDRHRPQSETRLSIQAANGLTYTVATRSAVFLGYEDRRAVPENQILVQRPADDGSVDRLLCTQLTVQLKPRLNSVVGSPRQTPKLELHSILAEGSRVVARLEQHNVTATMTSLRYLIDQSLLELWHNKVDDSGRPFPVEIRQDGSVVYAPHIMVLHGKNNQIHSLECHGPGMIQHRENADDEAVEVMWAGSMQYRQEPEPKIIVDGNIQLSQTAQQLRLTGQQLTLTLAQEPVSSAMERAAVSREGKAGGLNIAHLRPSLVVVRNNVRLYGPQVTGVARDTLTVRFSERTDNPTAEDAGRQTAANSAESGSAAVSWPQRGGTGAMDQSGFTHFECDTMEAVVQTPASVSRFTDVWLRGGVKVEHSAVDPEQSFSASGNVLQAKEGIHSGRNLRMFGDPASIVSTTRRIEGQRIELSELEREFRVEGSGRIRIVIDSLFGEPLGKPSPLDVYWSDQMHFSGRTATFVGSIRGVMKETRMHDIEMTCAGLKIHFSQDIGMNRSPGRADRQLLPVSSTRSGRVAEQASEIEQIECQSLVNVNISQFANGNPEARHHASFTDLVVNVQTGDFEAVGPGRIESTQPDRGNRLKFSPGVVARSNTPVRASENPFVFVSADFIGTVSGNMNQQVVRLSHHVVGVFGPVRRLGERIDVNGVNTSDLPPQAGVLRCEQLTVSAIPGSQTDEPSFSMQAETKARLELKEFSGEADRITYDHAKRQYILRSEQDRMATVSHRPGVGMDVRRFVGQKFEYYPPPRNKLTANQTIGLDGAF